MKTLVKALGLALFTVWIYAPSLHGTWLWDDGLEVAQNLAVRSASGWWSPWVRPEGMDYFPLKASLVWAEWHLWGANPLGYHVANLVLHIASALLVWRLLSLLGAPCAFLGGLLFAVHPMAVESVAWIAEFKNTVSLPLLLAASVCFVAADYGGYPSGRRWALGWFVTALLCKTSTVMLPFVLLLFCWWRRGRISVADLRATAPFFLTAAALGAVTVWFQSTRAIGLAGTPQALGARLSQAGWSLVSYVRLFLWPSGLLPEYPVHGGPAALSLVAGCGVGAALALFWWRRAAWGRHALLGSGWFLLNLVPVLGLIPMAYSRISPMADHFAYLPMVGLAGLCAVAVGAACRSLGASRWARYSLLAAVGTGLGALTLESRAYAAAFRDEKSLWTYAVERNPGAWLARNNLGRVLLQEGRADEADGQFREAIRLQPDSPEAHANLGNALEAQGRLEPALAEYAAALAINPRFAGGHYDLGLALLKARRMREAEMQFRAAIEADPGHAQAHNNLGLTFAVRGRLAEAVEQYRLCVALDAGLPEAHLNLGNALFRQGRALEAIGEYREALRLYPGYVGAHNNLALVLSSLGRQKEADVERDAARQAANH